MIDTRREQMLDELLEAMRRHHGRRRLRRRAGAGIGLAMIAVAASWIAVAREPAPQHFSQIEPPGPATPRILLHTGRTGLIREIDDDELVERLAEIDRPAGLIRTEGRVWLTSTVADADLESTEGL